MDFPPWPIVAFVLAGLWWAAYTHPNEYAKVQPMLSGAVAVAALLTYAWLMAVMEASDRIGRGMGWTESSAARRLLDPLWPPIWLWATFAVLYVYLGLLTALPAIGFIRPGSLEEKRPNEREHQGQDADRGTKG